MTHNVSLTRLHCDEDDVQAAMNELSIANSAPLYSLQLFDMSPYDPIPMEP